MNDRDYFDLDDETVTADQSRFLEALRGVLDDRLRPHCVEATDSSLFLISDIDAPDVALVSVGLHLRGNELRGDRVSVHDRAFPTTPTQDGFRVWGSVDELAGRGAGLLHAFAARPIVRHTWRHRGRVYAECYLFEDTGERLSQMYRGEWAPKGQEARLVDDGFVRGGGWIQTEGLGQPDEVFLVRGER